MSYGLFLQLYHNWVEKSCVCLNWYLYIIHDKMDNFKIAIIPMMIVQIQVTICLGQIPISLRWMFSPMVAMCTLIIPPPCGFVHTILSNCCMLGTLKRPHVKDLGRFSIKTISLQNWCTTNPDIFQSMQEWHVHSNAQYLKGTLKPLPKNLYLQMDKLCKRQQEQICSGFFAPLLLVICVFKEVTVGVCWLSTHMRTSMVTSITFPKDAIFMCWLTW